MISHPRDKTPNHFWGSGNPPFPTHEPPCLLPLLFAAVSLCIRLLDLGQTWCVALGLLGTHARTHGRTHVVSRMFWICVCVLGVCVGVGLYVICRCVSFMYGCAVVVVRVCVCVTEKERVCVCVCLAVSMCVCVCMHVPGSEI